MRATFLAGLIAAAFPALGPAAMAQTGTLGTITAPEGLEIGPDDEVVVREYIIRRRPAAPVVVAPAPTDPAPVVTGSIVVRPGSVIPADVDLEPFDDAPVPSLRRYGYFISPGNKVVVVDPADRRVVRILDR